ncbi:alpha/beta hydrolase domain-containing protein [Cubamyces sp. BRFM 1775]|nr:alpha/beta hydrolase domain-containing protein [Cubamyces sp. BRFM 1775]
MDTVASLNETAIPVVLQPTKDAFVKLLEKQRGEIESIACKTFRYGQTERHNLDVYYPPANTASSGPVPVLFFVYGGGFATGDRKQEPPYDLGYTNVGAFFVKRGIVTVIPDYRLVPVGKFPDQAEDIRDALTWFLSNTAPVSAASPSALSLDNPTIFVMGHSAGANIIATLFLYPTVLPLASPIRAATRGLIPQGGAYIFDFSRQITPPGLLETLYGSQERTLEFMPISLLKRADTELLKSFPDIFALVSELDPPVIKEGCDEFAKTLEERGCRVRNEVMKGHNHISPHWALCSGEGEEWGVQVAEWIKSKL